MEEAGGAARTDEARWRKTLSADATSRPSALAPARRAHEYILKSQCPSKFTIERHYTEDV